MEAVRDGAVMTQAFDPYHKWLGIPPAEQPPNHYRLLGLTLFEGDADAIESAADQRMAHVRTFQLGQHAETSQRLLNELAAARVCLLKVGEKSGYDRKLRDNLSRCPGEDNESRDSKPRSVDARDERRAVRAMVSSGRAAASHERYRGAARNNRCAVGAHSTCLDRADDRSAGSGSTGIGGHGALAGK